MDNTLRYFIQDAIYDSRISTKSVGNHAFTGKKAEREGEEREHR